MSQLLTKSRRVGVAGTLLALTLSLAACGSQSAVPEVLAEQQPAATTELQPQQLGAGDNNLSIEPFVSVTNAWGPVERDRSNGDQAAGDGRVLTLNGQGFARGFGTHAGSSMTFDLGGRCQTFTASVGVDDEVGAKGTVVFQVYADGVKLFDSGKLTGKSAARALSVPVAGKKELKLVVTDAGDGVDYDHADWVNPTLLSCTPLPAVAGVSVTPGTLSLTAGGTVQLTASVDAQNGASTSVSWASSAAGVATVDVSGRVTAVAPGTATVTATSAFDGSKKASVSVTVQAPPAAVAPTGVVYSAPITITQGGTYSGNWESTDPRVSAVTIKTTEPVVIENANLRSRQFGISGWGVNLTVRNTRSETLLPNVSGWSKGRSIHVEDLRNLRVENSSFTGGGIYIRKFTGDSAQGQGIRILRSTFSNIDGRKSDGSGGFSGGSEIRQAIQFNDVTRLPTAEIAWNQVINEPDKSVVEDNFNFFATSGTQASPILVHDNYIQGGYPLNPGTNSSYSGGGIMMGDGSTADPTMNGYIRVTDNQVVSTTNYGIAIAGGYGIEVLRNRIVSSGKLPDGSRIAAQNIGLYVWDMYGAGTSFGMHRVSDNVVGWTRVNTDGGIWTNNWWTPDGSKNGSVVGANTGLGAQTLDAEKAEFTRWQQKLSAAGVTVGAR